MNTTMLLIGLFFMGMSVYQMNKKTKMDDMIIKNYEKKHIILNRDKFLKAEFTCKALFGAWVSITAILQVWFYSDQEALFLIFIGLIIWQVFDYRLKKPYLKRK